MATRKSQSGIALITILLVFALATVVAADIMTRSHRDIRRSEHLFNDKQAYQFALSGEQYARQILYRDHLASVQTGIPVDTLEDNWALNLPTFDIDDGEMRIEIRDLQGLFNLNNLVESSGTINADALNTFKRLQNQLFTTRDYTDLVIDWLDSNDTPSAEGAEFPAYNQGYLPANAAFVERSELRLILDMNPEDYRKLEPYIVALPKQLADRSYDITKFNINTVDATLLEAISGLSGFETKKIEDRQNRGGYDDLAQWLGSSEGVTLTPVSNQLTVRSTFFEVLVTAEYQDRICIITTQFFRDPDSGNLSVIKRHIGAG